MFILILNCPPHAGIRRVQRRLAERLDASWEVIDPFGQLDDHRQLFEDDVASGFEEATLSVEGAIQRQQGVVLEWRLDPPTYDRLTALYQGRGCNIILVTVALPKALAMACASRREPTARKRLQVSRYFERGCHRQSSGLIFSALASDPDVAATSILKQLRDQGLLP